MKKQLLWIMLFIVSMTFSQNIVYVKSGAPVGGDGKSWATAFNTLTRGLTNIPNGYDVWVAKGTYKPHVSDVTVSFNIYKEGVHIYGGFSGTETTLADRDITKIHTDNPTILSGDLQGNDTAVELGHSSRADNSYNVVTIKSKGVMLDGFTITSGNNVLASQSRHGAGILADSSRGLRAENLILNNCIIKNNTALWAAGVSYQPYQNPSQLNVLACKFENNISALGGSGLYVGLTTDNFPGVKVKISNSLFSKNKSVDYTSSSTIRSLGAPAIWLRAYRGGTYFQANIVNSTFVDNQTTGTGTNTELSVLGFSSEGSVVQSSLNMSNNIFWGNTTNGSTATAIGNLYLTKNYISRTLTHSIDENNFSNITNNHKTATSNQNPNLTTDYKLQSGSPAIDTGDNSKILTGTTADLAGNVRIYNTTVDMGAYEFNPSLSVTNILQNRNIIEVYPNPVSKILSINTSNGIEKIEIYNVLGAKVLSTTANSVNVENFTKGIYIVKAQDKLGNIITKKVVKQ